MQNLNALSVSSDLQADVGFR